MTNAEIQAILDEATANLNSALSDIAAARAALDSGPPPPPPVTVTVGSSIQDGATLSGSQTWVATASTTNGVTDRVEFSVDGVVKWTETGGPYQFNGDPDGRLDTTTLPNGSHVLKVQAFAVSGESASYVANVAVSNTPPPPPPPPSGLPRYGGATGHVIQKDGVFSQASVDAELNKWKDIGCQVLRVDLLQSPTYLARFHTILSGCQARGMKMIACLRGTSGPYGAAAAGAYAKSMAQEFGTSIVCYEYVNEPNLGAPRYQAAAFGPEQAAVYNAMKGVNSNILVATCGMGWDGAGKFSNWWPVAYNNGAKDHFDVFSVHLYGDPAGGNWTEAFNTHAQYGQGKPIISTEGGSGSVSTHAAIYPKALHDQRIKTMCIYNMNLEVPGYNMWQGSVANSPGYTAYKNTPKT